MVGPITQDFWPRVNILKGFFFNSVSSSRIGDDFRNKVVQKLTPEKKKRFFNKKLSAKLIFISDFFFNSVDF